MAPTYHFRDLLSLPWWVYLAAPVTYLVGKIIVTGFYNILFHPLRKFPGPKIAAFTELYNGRKFLTGTYHVYVTELHEKYGPVVRLAPNELSFNSSTSWKDIYGHVPGRATFIKSALYQTDKTRAASIVTERDPKKHSALRRLLSHAFSAKALGEQEDIVQSYIDKFISQLNVYVTGPTGDEMVKWYNFLTFDIIGDLAFGEAFGSLNDAEPHFWVETILDGIASLNWLSVIQKITGKTKLGRKVAKKLVPKELQEKRARHERYTSEKTRRRMESNTTRKDFMSKILAEKDAQNISVPELEQNAATLIVAGSETTATFLSGATYYLCRNPHAYKKLAEEIRTTFKEYSQIDGHATEKCTYLKAVIEETLRCYPPVPFGMPRESPGEVVDGHFVPKGVQVSTSSWAATHSPANFHRPYDFLPERWIDPECKDKKEASQPFLLGTRVCLGRNLALLEMRCVLAKMFFVYDMELLDKELNWDKQNKSIVLWRKPPTKVRYTKREGLRMDL